MKREKKSFLEYFMDKCMMVTAGIFFIFIVTIVCEIIKESDEWYYTLVYLALALVSPIVCYISWRIKYK
jgi:hypothetical protein